MAAPDFAAPNICTERLAVPRPKEQTRSKAQFMRAAALVEMLLSFVSGAAAFSLSSFAIHSLARQSLREAGASSISLGLILCFLDRRATQQNLSCGLLRIRESERTLRASIQSIVILFLFSLIWNLNVPSDTYLVAFIIVPVVFLAQKHATLTAFQRWQRSTSYADRAILYGAGESARAIASALNNSLRLGVQLVNIAEPVSGAKTRQINVLGYRGRASVSVQRRTITPALLEHLCADLLVLSATNLSEEEWRAAKCAAEEANVEVGIVYDYADQSNEQIICKEIDGLMLARPTTRHEAWHFSVIKRINDVVLSLVLLLLLGPLLLLIALLIRFDSPGPALFVQTRVGRGGALFNMYKFRSMYASAPRYEVSPTSSQDLRITRIGRFLRRTSLDELPQLFNVLLGNMSLVGPRPEMPFIVDGYDMNQRRRLAVTPGITGLWQLSADRAFPIHHNIEYDLYYIRNRNSFMDLAILIHTLFFAVSGGV